MRLGLVLAVLIVPGIGAAIPTDASGQAPTISGVVTDTLGRPLAGTAVALDPNVSIRFTRTDEAGRFRFDNVAEGSHAIRTVRIGFRPDDRLVSVGPSGLEVSIVLVPIPFRLDTLTITARRSGIIGIVRGRRSLQPLNKAIVQVLGMQWRLVTDTSGRFEFPAVPTGGFTVGFQRDGYLSRMITVAVPESGAVEITAVLDSLTTNRQKRAEQMFRDMRSRVSWRQRNTSAIVGSQELLSTGDSTLDVALRHAPSVFGKGLIPVSTYVCSIMIDGTRSTLARLKDFDVRQIAMVEVYKRDFSCPRPSPRRPDVMIGTKEGPPGYRIFVWTKRWELPSAAPP